jgi:nucleotide-binding universal stress UspA family protein
MQPNLLLATDGLDGSIGAVRLARDAALLHGARVEVVTVHEHGSRDGLRAGVEAQLAAVGGPAPGWPITVKHGPVAPLIARSTSDTHATAVVMGLHHYGLAEHWIGRETPLRVMHLTHVPVLAVPSTATALPRRVVIATDLGAVSLRAGRDALALAAPDPEVHLLHVLPPEADAWGTAEAATGDVSEARVRFRLAELARELGHAHEGAIQLHLLSGEPGEEILRFAAEVKADLIAVGSHSYSLFDRVLLGSVASYVVRGAGCSVLVAPTLQVASDLRLNLIEAELLAHLGRAGEMALPTLSPALAAGSTS